MDSHSERVPYTIAESDPVRGTLSLVVQEVGLSSTKLCQLPEGAYVQDIVGPLGTPSKIEKYGTVVCAGGGIGIAAILPILTALHKAGNKVVSVLAGRTKNLIILEEEVRANSDEVIIMTDDGSYGQKGVVTVGVEQVIQREHVDKVLAIGPPMMMKFTSLLAKKYNIPNDVSLNTIMVDGTGMCGACRPTIGGKTRFVCIDGPEFNGDEVDWDEMMSRMNTFKGVEREEMQHWIEEGDNALTDRTAPWRADLRKAMKPKERMAIPRVQMPELDAAYRATTRTEEVNKGDQGDGRAGSAPLPRLCQALVCRRLSRAYPDSRLYQEYRAWQYPRRCRRAASDLGTARCLWPCLPAGEAV